MKKNSSSDESGSISNPEISSQLNNLKLGLANVSDKLKSVSTDPSNGVLFNVGPNKFIVNSDGTVDMVVEDKLQDVTALFGQLTYQGDPKNNF